MPDRCESTLTVAVIRERAEWFASLRAAQRALSRSVHPSELELSNQQGRQLLIQLQALSVRAKEAVVSERSGGQEALDRADLLRVDELLDDICSRTQEILDGLEIAHLRSTVLLLASQHPDEVRGLIDVMLEGDLEDDKKLRTLEYLVTVLSSEERNGRRILVREPSEASRRLREVAGQRLADADGEHLVAERIFGSALTMLPDAQDLGAIRDRIRRYKEELGSRILHPRILEAAVSYNVVMWNQVAGLIAGSRSIDSLADELISADFAGDAGDSVEAEASPSPALGGTEILGSAAFGRIVSALRERLLGRDVSDPNAGKVVVAYRLDHVQAEEVEAFETQEEGPTAQLIRAAVALRLTVEHLAEVEDALRALKLDPDVLKSQCVDALMGEMTAAARKLFADSHYDEAFRLSEAKTRNLAEIATGRGGDAGPPAPRRSASGRGARRSGALRGGLGRVFQLDGGLPAGQVWAAVFLLALPLMASVLWTSGAKVSMISPDDLSQISPFLASGFRRQLGDHTQFVGRLSRGWDYLGNRERLRVTGEIGIAFKDRGVDSVVLEDEWKRVQARYDGRPVLEEGMLPTPPTARP
jgi:hypothetical protein